MNILVIGGTHFIGPYVVAQLIEQGHQVTLFHRGKTQADLPAAVCHLYGDRAQLHRYREDFYTLAPDVVLDMVAYTEADAQAMVDVFKGMTQRVVVISSVDVYRARDIIWNIETGVLDPVPLTEQSPLRSHLYPFRDLADLRGDIPADYDKILVEQAYQRTPELPATVLRLPMVYGPRDYRHRLQTYLKRMDDGRSAIVLEANMATWQGSYGYVENVATAIALAVVSEQAAGHIYNIAEPDSLSEADFIRAIGQQAGWQGRIVEIPSDQMPDTWQASINTAQHWIFDSTRIRQDLGFAEKISRAEGLRRTIAWERTTHSVGLPHNPDLLPYEVEDNLLATLSHLD